MKSDKIIDAIGNINEFTLRCAQIIPVEVPILQDFTGLDAYLFSPWQVVDKANHTGHVLAEIDDLFTGRCDNKFPFPFRFDPNARGELRFQFI